MTDPEVFRAKTTANLHALSSADRRDLVEEIRRLALRRKITYEYDKSAGEEPIRILMPPLFLPRDILPELQRICRTVAGAAEKALGLFLERPEVREIFPFEEQELRMILISRPEEHAKTPVIWQRLDGVLDPTAPLESLRLMEANMNSVGGVYYAPAVEKLAFDSILPKLLTPQDQANIHPHDDLERLLLELLTRHARRQSKLGPDDAPRIAVVENDPDAEGCTESPAVAEGLSEFGADAFLARPEEFEIRGRTLLHLGRPVDLVYRLFELREMLEMSPRAPMELALSEHRMVSSLGGEFDHKSLFELLTAAAYDRFFPAADRHLFRKHILWTRMLRETFTDDPRGNRVDLPEFAYASREKLVMKPNRSYGGEGIKIGPEMDNPAWQRAVEEAMRKPGGFVVQAYRRLPELNFSVIDASGEVSEESMNVVLGFSATPAGFGVIGRASRSSVVNVAQHGGLVPVLSVQ